MKYMIVEVPFSQYVNVCIQVKRWYGWVTFKTFETEYEDKDEYEYCMREANSILETLKSK